MAARDGLRRDVRDMLCAQALAVVAQAVARLAEGQTVTIHYNADDVHRDLVAWAAAQGCAVREAGRSVLQIRRGGAC